MLLVSNCWSNKISSRLLTRYAFKWMLFLKMVPMKLLLLLFAHWWLPFHIQLKDLEIISLTLFLNKLWLEKVLGVNHSLIYLVSRILLASKISEFLLFLFNLTYIFCPRFPNLQLRQTQQVIWCVGGSEPMHFVRQSELSMLQVSFKNSTNFLSTNTV